MTNKRKDYADKTFNGATDYLNFSFQITPDGKPLLTILGRNIYKTKNLERFTVTQLSGDDFIEFQNYIKELPNA